MFLDTHVLEARGFVTYLVVNVMRVTVRFVQSQFQGDCLRFRKRHALELPAFVHGRGIVGQRDVTQIIELRCNGSILLLRRPNFQLLRCKGFAPLITPDKKTIPFSRFNGNEEIFC